MESRNPALKNDVFEKESRLVGSGGGEVMTLSGALNKSICLVAICAFTAAMTWQLQRDATEAQTALAPMILIGSIIGGFIVAMITTFKHSWSPITAPLYAVFEGVLLGAISQYFEKAYPGIVLQAVFLTFGDLFALLLLYRTGIIRVNDKFRTGVIAATGAVALVYLVNMILRFFGHSIPFIHESGAIGIGFSVVVVVIASMNLLLDFDLIEQGVAAEAPQYMEWYSGFALLVTLVWLYMEVLRLLSKTRRSNS